MGHEIRKDTFSVVPLAAALQVRDRGGEQVRAVPEVADPLVAARTKEATVGARDVIVVNREPAHGASLTDHFARWLAADGAHTILSGEDSVVLCDGQPIAFQELSRPDAGRLNSKRIGARFPVLPALISHLGYPHLRAVPTCRLSGVPAPTEEVELLDRLLQAASGARLGQRNFQSGHMEIVSHGGA